MCTAHEGRVPLHLLGVSSPQSATTFLPITGTRGPRVPGEGHGVPPPPLPLGETGPWPADGETEAGGMVPHTG